MSDNAQYKAALRAEGATKFEQARGRAFWQEMFSLLRGKPAELLSFEEIRTRLRLREESYRGLQDVPLDQIVGSVGRYRDFTGTFLPKTDAMKERWSRVYAEATGFSGLPPIELYKVGDTYYVRDGNHRVSVARELGAKTIQAHVTELPTTVEIFPGMSDKELDAATAYAAFLEETGLSRTRPHHQSIKLSEPSRYHDLLGHIYLHARILEEVTGEPISSESAAADWYDNVYRPAVTLIRKYDILDKTGDRTEGDLYLWIVDHLRQLRQQYGRDVPLRSFSDALVDYLQKNKIPVPEELESKRDDSVALTRSQVMRAVTRRKAEDDESAEDESPDEDADH